jgi:hypothetical protein
MARGVDAGHADEITGANAHAARMIVRGKSGEQLHDLAVDVERDEALAVRIEAHHGAGVVLDRALERRRGGGLESEEHPPERTDEQPLEHRGSEDGGAGAPGLAEWVCEQPTGAEADEQGEQHARREERVEPAGGVVVAMVARLIMRCVSRVPSVSRMRTVAVTGVAMPTMPTVSIVPDVGEAADRHRGEARSAQRETEPIDVHTTNTTCRAGSW